MWVNKAVWSHLSVTEDGRPTAYYQFIANVMAENLNDTILPISMSSIIGARFLQTFQFHPQLIYPTIILGYLRKYRNTYSQCPPHL